MRAVLYNPYSHQTGSEWMLWAVAALFAAVLVGSFLLVQFVDRRDARIRAAFEDYLGARYKLMMAVRKYQAGGVPDIRAAIAQMLLLGRESLEAFKRAKALMPDLEPDPGWTGALLLVQQKAKLFDL